MHQRSLHTGRFHRASYALWRRCFGYVFVMMVFEITSNWSRQCKLVGVDAPATQIALLFYFHLSGYFVVLPRCDDGCNDLVATKWNSVMTSLPRAIHESSHHGSKLEKSLSQLSVSHPSIPGMIFKHHSSTQDTSRNYRIPILKNFS